MTLTYQVTVNYSKILIRAFYCRLCRKDLHINIGNGWLWVNPCRLSAEPEPDLGLQLPANFSCQ